jgi:hypothetical protein
MDFPTIWATLNSGIPSEALGGVAGAGILASITKIKSYFSDKQVVTEVDIKSLYENNESFKNEISALSEQLKSSGITQIGTKNNHVNINLGTISF